MAAIPPQNVKCTLDKPFYRGQKMRLTITGLAFRIVSQFRAFNRPNGTQVHLNGDVQLTGLTLPLVIDFPTRMRLAEQVTQDGQFGISGLGCGQPGHFRAAGKQAGAACGTLTGTAQRQTGVVNNWSAAVTDNVSLPTTLAVALSLPLGGVPIRRGDTVRDVVFGLNFSFGAGLNAGWHLPFTVGHFLEDSASLIGLATPAGLALTGRVVTLAGYQESNPSAQGTLTSGTLTASVTANLRMVQV